MTACVAKSKMVAHSFQGYSDITHWLDGIRSKFVVTASFSSSPSSVTKATFGLFPGFITTIKKSTI